MNEKLARIDHINTLLILLSCAAAHLLPYHLLIFSYAFLGPAHYLTQISWLHDRKYFARVPQKITLMFTLVFTFALVVSSSYLSSAMVLTTALAFALIATIPGWRLKIAATVSGGLLGLMVWHAPKSVVFIALLLPTVIHIFLFTASFMLVGALRNKQMSSYISLAGLLVCATTFLMPAQSSDISNLSGLYFFIPVVEYLQSLIVLPETQQEQIFGFLAFAYTYHYLNWFSKVEVIRWHHAPKTRMIAIVVIYVLILSLYIYDYKWGFYAALFLSLMHVLLEFPLNWQTFAYIGKALPRKIWK